jgi:hypothetical protein
MKLLVAATLVALAGYDLSTIPEEQSAGKAEFADERGRACVCEDTRCEFAVCDQLAEPDVTERRDGDYPCYLLDTWDGATRLCDAWCGEGTHGAAADCHQIVCSGSQDCPAYGARQTMCEAGYCRTSEP